MEHLDFVVLTVAHPDFFAGAIATFAVFLFAKFATHHVRQMRAEPNSAGVRRPSRSWNVAHWICAWTAWLGLGASLLFLADPTLTGKWELGGRWLVGLLAFISGTILAWDVAFAGYNPANEVSAARKARRDKRSAAGTGKPSRT